MSKVPRNAPAGRPVPASQRARFDRWAWPILVSAVAAAYLSSFGGVFVFDDHLAIAGNPTFRDGFRLDRVLFYPGELAGTVGGRPLANLTLALNFALGGLNPWGYHAFNVLVHALAAACLYGLLGRIFAHERLRAFVGKDRAAPLALVCAALWALHPLQTESVTYVVQRVESLAGLFYLLTLLCFIQSMDTQHPQRWRIAGVTACFLGVATKEVLVSAPLFALLLDRALYASSWREVWRRRAGVHAALLSSWLLLALLVADTGGRGGSAGFGTGVSPWTYLLTQAGAIVHYVRLAFWPHPLVFDYGTSLAGGLAEVWWQAVALVALALATAWAVAKRPLLALPGAWFFLLLAPSSSIVPIATQTMAEHRMYLPLAALVVVVTLFVHRWAGARGLLGLAAVALLSGGLTHARNRIYHDELALWKQTAERRPDNVRAWTTVGLLTAERGDPAAAIGYYEKALALAPDNAPTLLNLSGALLALNLAEEAARHAAEAMRLEPANANARVNLGNALTALGRPEEAVAHYDAALALEPGAEDILLNLAAAWSARGDPARAARFYGEAARAHPDRARTWYEFAVASLESGDRTTARRAVDEALRRAPDDAEAHFLRGNLAAADEDLVAALRHFRRAVDLAPEYVEARANLGNALLVAGRVDEAIAHYREVLRIRPDEARVRENLEQVLAWQRSQGGGR